MLHLNCLIGSLHTTIAKTTKNILYPQQGCQWQHVKQSKVGTKKINVSH